MESDESYLRRKKEELDLIAACLSQLQEVCGPQSFEDVIEQKCRLARTCRRLRAAHRRPDRNGRRMLRRLRAAGVRVTTYQHGVYALLHPQQNWELEDAKQVAARLVADLRHDALPVRHAGSFGFDFCSLDGFPDPGGDRHLVRLAFSDIPCHVAGQLADAIARWWLTKVIGNASDGAQRAA